MAEYGYSSILKGIKKKIENDFETEISDIDFNNIAKKALRNKGIDLGSLVDINPDILADIMGEAVSEALKNGDWKSKIKRQHIDISDLLDLDERKLNKQINDYYKEIQEAFDEGGEKLEKAQKNFMRAMITSNQKKEWIAGSLDEKEFEHKLKKMTDSLQQALAIGDKDEAERVRRSIRVANNKREWASEYQALLTETKVDARRNDTVLSDELTDSAKEYQKMLIDISRTVKESNSQMATETIKDIGKQQEKVKKTFKDFIGQDKLEVVDEKTVRNLSDIGLTVDQMREKLRLEAEEIKKGNMAYKERITLLKDGKVVDSFIGEKDKVGIKTSKQFDTLFHTHPDNEPGSYNFGNNDVKFFGDDKKAFSIFRKAELITNGITQVVMDFANMTEDQIREFSEMYDDAEHTVRAAFGKMQENGLVDLHDANFEEVSKYLNALGSFFMKDFGGAVKYFQSGAIDPNKFKQIYDAYLQAHELFQAVWENSPDDDTEAKARKVVIKDMYDNFHNTVDKETKDMENTAKEDAVKVKEAAKKSVETIKAAVDEGIAEATDSHSPSVEAGKQMDNVIDGFVEEAEQRLPEVKQTGEEIGEAVKSGIKESTADVSDDMEAYLAQMDQKVAPKLNLDVKETAEDMRDLGKETSKVMEIWKEFGTPSEALDSGSFERTQEILDYLGGKFAEMNVEADNYSEHKLNAEFYRELIKELDLTEDQLTVIKGLIEDINTLAPGGRFEHLYGPVNASKFIYGELDKIKGIINGEYQITDKDLKDAKMILDSVQTSIEETSQAEVQMGQQSEVATEQITEGLKEVQEEAEKANAVIEEQKQKIVELEGQVDDLRSSLKAQGDELAHANEEYSNMMDELGRANDREDLISEELTNERLKREEIEEQNKALKEQNELLEQQRKEAEANARFYEEMSHIAAGSEAESDRLREQEYEARREAEQQLKAQQEITEQLKEQQSAQEDKIATLEKERAYYEEAANNGEREIDSLTAQKKLLEEQLADVKAKAEASADNESVKKLQDELDTLKAQYAELGKMMGKKSVKAGTKEAEDFNKLKDVLDEITKAIKAKTEAFKEEQKVVKDVVKSEVGDVQQLKGAVDAVKQAKKEKKQQEQNKELDNERKVVRYYERLQKNEARYQELKVKQDAGYNLTKSEMGTLGTLQRERDLEDEILKTVVKRSEAVERARQGYLAISEFERENRYNALTSSVKNDITAGIEKLQGKIDTGKFTDSSVAGIVAGLERIRSGNYLDENNIAQLRDYVAQLDNLDAALVKAGNHTKLVKLLGDVNSTINENSRMSNDLRTNFRDLGEQIQEAINTEASQDQVRALTDRFLELKNEMIESGEEGRSFFDMIVNDIGQASARAIAQYASFQDWMNYIGNAVNSVTELDSALTQLKIISGQSDTALNNLAKSAYELGNNLGMATTEVLSSITEWKRLGYTVEESMILAEQAARLSTGGMMDISSATTALVSSMQAFEMKADEVNKVVDQYIYLGKGIAHDKLYRLKPGDGSDRGNPLWDTVTTTATYMVTYASKFIQLALSCNI